MYYDWRPDLVAKGVNEWEISEVIVSGKMTRNLN